MQLKTPVHSSLRGPAALEADFNTIHAMQESGRSLFYELAASPGRAEPRRHAQRTVNKNISASLDASKTAFNLRKQQLNASSTDDFEAHAKF